ncbi:MAG TPA: MFS transporter [Bryobacteraceae bacterium]|nr:MFS transporter [Bryobacteraceae bacterium]
MQRTAPLNKRMILIVTGSATLMVFWLGSGINLVLPMMARQFGVDISTVTAVSTVYSLAMCACTIPFGLLSDKIGCHKVFLTGAGLFTVFSALAGFAARGYLSLLIFRAAMGIGASMMQSVTVAILTMSFPAKERGKVLGLNSMCISASVVLGLVLCGRIAERLGWQALFFCGIPFGIFSLAAGIAVLPRSEAKDSRRTNFPGAMLLTCLLIGVTLFLNLFSNPERTTPGFRAAVAGACALILAGFLSAQKAAPVIRFYLFKNRGYSVGCLLMFAAYAASQLTSLTIPFFVVNVLGLTSSDAGMISMAFPLTMAVMAPFCGALSDRIGTRGMMLAGMLMQLLGTAAFTLYGAGTSTLLMAGVMGWIGFSGGLFYSPNVSSILSTVPHEDLGLASGMTSAIRNFAATFGTSMFSIGTARYMARFAALGESAAFSATQRQIAGITTGLLVFVWLAAAFLLPSPGKDGDGGCAAQAER